MCGGTETVKLASLVFTQLLATVNISIRNTEVPHLWDTVLAGVLHKCSITLVVVVVVLNKITSVYYNNDQNQTHPPCVRNARKQSVFVPISLLHRLVGACARGCEVGMIWHL